MAVAEFFQDTTPMTSMGQRILKDAFDVIKTGVTGSEPRPAMKRVVKIGTWRNGLRGKQTLTEAIDLFSQATTSRNAIMDENQAQDVSEITLVSAGWRSAAADLEIARSLADGWKGPNSCKPLKNATDDAASILSAMATIFATTARPVAPALGVAADGEIVMSWGGRDGLFGSMSISGDGTFAFYVERGNIRAEDGDVPIAAALPKPFIDVLLGEEAGQE
jgi:hypothetical protein